MRKLVVVILILCAVVSLGLHGVSVDTGIDSPAFAASSNENEEPSAFRLLVSFVWDKAGDVICWVVGLAVKVALWLVHIITFGLVDNEYWYNVYEGLFALAWDWIGDMLAEIIHFITFGYL